MNKLQVVIAGADGHARSCIDAIEQSQKFSICGLVDANDEVGSEMFGYPVLGTDSELGHSKIACEHAVIAVGQIKNPKLRKKLFSMLTELGYSLTAEVSTRAYVSSNASIEKGSTVIHGAVTTAGVRIGQNCIIDSMSLSQIASRNYELDELIEL